MTRFGLRWILSVVGLAVGLTLLLFVSVLFGVDGNVLWLVLYIGWCTPVLLVPGIVLVIAGLVRDAGKSPNGRRQRILAAWRQWPGHSTPARAGEVQQFHGWLIEHHAEWLGAGAERFGLPELHAWLGPMAP
jgi:hypothetical protein